jgi:hypothetical protein
MADVGREGKNIEREGFKSFKALDIINQVFPEEGESRRFIAAITELHESGAKIKVGGRRLREAIGCSVNDFASYVVSDARYLLDVHQGLRLGLLGKYLWNFDEERMVKPDLDLFFWNVPPERMEQVFREHGFDVSFGNATGGVKVMGVVGSQGKATLTDGMKSWQTGNAWPRYGVMADFVSSPTPSFIWEEEYDRLSYDALNIPEISLDPTDPQRVAAVARALLWSISANDISGDRLPVPSYQTERAMIETVREVYTLIKKIDKNPEELEGLYRGSLRDLALAMRVILLSNWEEVSSYGGAAAVYARFFKKIDAAWRQGVSAGRVSAVLQYS